MLRVMAFGVKKTVPVLWGVALVVGHWILMDLTLWLSGAQEAVQRMGDEAVDTAARRGVPSSYHPLIYWSATVLAVAELVVGWCVLSFITVWLVKVIF